MGAEVGRGEQHFSQRNNKETAVCLLYYIALREPPVTTGIIPAYTTLDTRGSGQFLLLRPVVSTRLDSFQAARSRSFEGRWREVRGGGGRAD